MQLYRPSLARLASRHAKLLGESHPLALLSTKAGSDVSVATSSIGESGVEEKKAGRFSKTFKSSAKLASNFLQSGVTSLSPATSTPFIPPYTY